VTTERDWPEAGGWLSRLADRFDTPGRAREKAACLAGAEACRLVPQLQAALATAKRLLRAEVDAGPHGHRFEPWSERMLEEFIRPQLADPDPIDGPPHPTCSACSRHNNPLTTQWAHERFQRWLDAKNFLEGAP